jgi:hypothetical protein
VNILVTYNQATISRLSILELILSSDRSSILGESALLDDPTTRDSMLSGKRSGVVARDKDCVGAASLVLSVIASISALAESCRSRTSIDFDWLTSAWIPVFKMCGCDGISKCLTTCSILLKYYASLVGRTLHAGCCLTFTVLTCNSNVASSSHTTIECGCICSADSVYM